MVILTVFGGGAFIRWDQVPDYWLWLQESSLFTQASRSAILHVMDALTYDCNLTAAGGACVGPTGAQYSCNAPVSVTDTTCQVDGREVMLVDQGVGTTDRADKYFGILVAIFLICRLSQLALMYYPVKRMTFMLREVVFGPIVKEVLATRNTVKRLEGQLRFFMARSRGKYISSPSTSSAHVTVENGQMGSAKTSNGYRPVGDSDDVMDTIEDLGVVGDVEKLIVGGGARKDGNENEMDGLTWTNLSVILPSNGKRLIDSVTGGVKRGRVLALMGPSGAGKTTLLNALANRAQYARVEGDVRFCGRPVMASDIMYVPQFDELNPQLTVWEQVELVGQLTCTDQDEMHGRLANLLQVLGLQPKRDVKCSELSGGELKRVSIAVKVIASPSILFLDEPSTGLDSTAALSLARLTVELARSTNVAIIMTIHQPAAIVFYMLQDLMLLEGGRLAYYGPLHDARPYFSSLGYACPADANPADYYLDLIYKPPQHEPTKTWTDLFNRTSQGQSLISRTRRLASLPAVALPDAPTAPIRPTDSSRTMTLMSYFSTFYLRETGIYPLRMVFLSCIGIFIGTMFLDLVAETSQLTKYGGIIFFSIWSTLFSAVAATGLVASERRQAVEQVKNGIITPALYCFAQFMSSLPFNLVCSLIFQAILYWLSGINPSGEVFVYCIIITWGHLQLMEAIMMLVVQGLKDAMLSVTFAMVVSLDACRNIHSEGGGGRHVHSFRLSSFISSSCLSDELIHLLFSLCLSLTVGLVYHPPSTSA